MLRSDVALRLTITEVLEHPFLAGVGLKNPTKNLLRDVRKFSPQTRLRTLLLPTMTNEITNPEREGLRQVSASLYSRRNNAPRPT